MSTLAENALAREVAVGEEEFTVRLEDGRAISVPFEWFPRLAEASAAERQNVRLIGGGVGIRWPDVDEDIAVETLLRPEVADAPETD